MTQQSRTGRQHPRDGRIDELSARLQRAEHRLLQLQNAVSGIARETGDLSVGGPCSACSESLLLVKRNALYCPKCGYGRSL